MRTTTNNKNIILGKTGRFAFIEKYKKNGKKISKITDNDLIWLNFGRKSIDIECSYIGKNKR